MSNENLKKVYQTVLKDFPEHKDTFGDYEFFQEKMKDPESAEKLRKLLRTKYNRKTLGDSTEFSNKVKISENDIEKSEEKIHQNITNKPAEKILAEEILNINDNQTQILDQNTTEQNNFKKINPIQESIERDVDSQIDPVIQDTIEPEINTKVLEDSKVDTNQIASTMFKFENINDSTELGKTLIQLKNLWAFKFGERAAKYGAVDSGVEAADGGTWAQWPDEESMQESATKIINEMLNIDAKGDLKEFISNYINKPIDDKEVLSRYNEITSKQKKETKPKTSLDIAFEEMQNKFNEKIDLNSDIYKPDQQKFTGESVDQSAFPQEFEDNILEKAVKDTAGDIAGAVEIPLAMASSLIGFGASGVTAIIERAFSGEMDSENLENMMTEIREKITYEPKTESAQEGLRIISYPFEKFVEATDELGEIVYDYTGSPVLATAAKTVSEGSLYLYGPLKAKYNKYKTVNKNKNAVAINDIADMKMDAKLMRDLIYDDVIVNNMPLDAVIKKYNIPKDKKPMAGLLVKEIKDSWAAELKEIPYEIVTEGNVINALKPKTSIKPENIKEVKISTMSENKHVVQVTGKNNKALDVEIFPTLEAAKASTEQFVITATLSSKSNLKLKKDVKKTKEIKTKVPAKEKVIAETLPDKLVVLNNTISSLQKKKELGPLDGKDKKKLGQLVILRTRVQSKIRETKKELLDKETELKETTGFFNKKQESIDFQLSSLKAKQKERKITPNEKIDIRRLEKEKKDLIQEQKNYEIKVKKDVVTRLSKTRTELEKQIRFASRKGSQSTPLEKKELNRKISKVHKLISRLENEKGVSIASEVYGQTYSTIIPPGLIHVFKIIERKLKAKGSKPFTDADIEHIDYIINQSGDILPNDFDINNKYYVQETGHNAFLTKVRKRKLEIAKSNKQVIKWNEKVPDELDRADIGAYVEGIGNILIENDTFADVKKRMTPKKLEVYNQYKRSIEKARVDINSYLKEFAGANQDYIGFLENYLPHFYVDVDGKGYQFAIDKLKSSKNAQKRKLPTLQEALDAGLSPKSQDPGVLYNLYTTLNWTMATNKMFSHDLHKIITPEGNRAVIPNYKNVEHPSDYIYYNHPILNKAYSMPNKKGEFKESHNGVWVHPQLKAPLDMLKQYDQFGMTPDGKGYFKKLGETYDMFNNSAKSFSLGFSLFHNIALFESAQAVLANKNPIRGVFLFGDKSPLTSKKQYKFTHRAGLDLIKDEKYFEDMLMAGLEITHPSMDNHKGTWENIRDGLTNTVEYYTGSKKANNLIKKTFDNTIIKHQDLLWNHYHSGLKAYAYVDIVEKSKNLFPELSLTEIKEITASNVNNAFGGQEWESKLILGNPEILKWTRRALLSPDWTYSSAAMGAGGINALYKKISSKLGYGGKDLLGKKAKFKGDKYTNYQSKFYFNYWKNMALTLGGTALLSQYAIYQAFGDEELDEPLTYNNEKDKRWEIDITPMLRHFANKQKPGSWTTKQRYYTSLGKQAKELYGYVEGIFGPRNTLLRKSSPMFQFGYEAAVGETISGFSSDWSRDNVNTYDLITSAMGRIVKSYTPFSLQGNSLGFALPISKGKTPFKAEKEMAEIMHAYVDPGIVQRIKNKYTSDQISTLFGVQKFDPFVYEEKFTEFFPEIIKALERNGYNSESVLKNVVGGLATQYNRELMSIGLDKNGNWRNPEELSEKDKFLMEYAAYKLFKLNKNASNFAKSLKGKLKSGKLQGYDTDYFDKYRQIWQDAYDVLPDPQNDPEKWLRGALKNDYFTKYQKDIVNLARLKVEASILKDKLINN